ncbi:Zinc finger and BTB domain-containing protein 49 [Mizuhopecten yessoensis]|uniref:Zinc finger and BTB domain-containing protein 49 n=2 Tax=Mizuhopecten yessoensis TaxID=6573 RepID=A0A210Q3K6_MIZYE|nr:Zinc finger and BTB domain-containing protein 49 [Mizuhopecten yessoensis]
MPVNISEVYSVLPSSDRRTFKCDICSSYFSTDKSLDKHRKSHGTERFSCHICQKKFHFMSYLKAHVKCHSDARPHVCQYCGRSYKHLHNLKEHRCSGWQV